MDRTARFARFAYGLRRVAVGLVALALLAGRVREAPGAAALAAAIALHLLAVAGAGRRDLAAP